jgi:FAD/FMN-containing dehydrogenase
MPQILVNDIHSQLNATPVDRVVEVDSVEAIRAALADADLRDRPVSVAGGRYASGGQQFCAGGVVLDTRPLDRVLDFDREAGTIEVEAGIEWSALLRHLYRTQEARPGAWAIAQKPSGVDRATVGGGVSANVHGSGLGLAPLAADVEAIRLVDADGSLRTCSRRENPDLFRLACGGYGLFGVLYSVRLRLVRRRKVERVVELVDAADLAEAFADRTANGHLYGEAKLATDADATEFLGRAILASYRPVDDMTPIEPGQRTLSTEDWRRLIHLAHTDKAQAFDLYARHALATSGQIYYSDAHQLSAYVDDYHRVLDTAVGASRPATDAVAEVCVPPAELTAFLEEAAAELRRDEAELVHASVRLVQPDRDTFLTWARERYACMTLYLHTPHTVDGLARSSETVRRLIDVAAGRGGSYHLTYHRWAYQRQLESCHPELPEFLRLKRAYDPRGRFQSQWYRHMAALFAEDLCAPKVAA